MSDTGAAGASSAGRRPRYDLVDAVRGIAIIGVVFYHFFWDLSYFYLIEVDVSTHPAWVTFARTLLAAFIVLVGVGLVLGHGNGIRWRPFWRRFAIVGGAALLVTIGTYIAFPATFVFFGVLHAIAVFSLVGLAFLRLPIWLVTLLGAIMIVGPLLFTDPVFIQPTLAWIGFWPYPPPTNDLVPIFPWLGVTLLGIALTRWSLAHGFAERIGHWQASGLIGRTLVKAGRWSLIIYLVHQPIMLAAIVPLANFAVGDTASINSFNRTCEIGCTNTGADVAYCTTYCACALDGVIAGDLWDAVEALEPTPEQTAAVGDVVLQCSGVPQDLRAPTN